MKIGFHLENLTFRGTVTAVKDYAFYNQKILNNDSLFFYKKGLLDINNDENFSKKNEIFESFSKKYELYEYSDINDLEEKTKKRNINYVYFLKAGFNDGLFLRETKSLIHCVFNNYQPHGHKYAYVSEWLAKESSKRECDFVPHIVELPKIPSENFRNKLNIGYDKIVIGRYGGYDQFDIEFVKSVIAYIVNNDPKFVFIFVNTRKFIEHPNVFFLDPIIDSQEKTNFILSCDAMIHARSDGESFGLSICEFLLHNKPVISFGGGRDKNNVELLKNKGLIYNNEYELLECLFKLKYFMYKDRYATIAESFSPSVVMEKFEKVFLR